MCFVHIRVRDLDEDGEPAKKGGGGLCNMTRNSRGNNSSNKPFPEYDMMQKALEKPNQMHHSHRKNTSSEEAVATLKWEGVFG